VFLLEGITGSGKTEVYLDAIQAALEKKQQALVLVPEISLTPQLTQRFQARFDRPIAILHSQLTDKQRLDAWLAAREGEADIVIGTRSAITAPLPRLGLIVVDEEHDSSFKQQEGFRYSARDLAVMRGHIENIPVVLGSATPSFETLHNVYQGRYQHLKLQSRHGNARLPTLKVIDLRSQPLVDGLSLELREQMKRHLDQGNQVILFINRRGFAPTLLCHDCGWIARCQRCDSHMTLHQAKNKLRCHHCGAERRAESACPSCQGTSLIPVGEGTERVESSLNQLFPDNKVIRIDRDTTRRKGSLESILQDVHGGEARILVGTQMLAKGHHFPNVTLVGILNIDQGFFSVDFHALEKTAQLIVQVAGRAGREEKPGTVMLQTHYPDHPLLQTLLNAGYDEFARQAMVEREQANLPPYSYMALLRAEAVDARQPIEFLQEAKAMAQQHETANVEFWGPLPSPMEKRAGRYRAQLFIQSLDRAALHRLLAPWIRALEKSRLGRKVRWSIDVDPVDVY
jgi:primosomal protein N' (replication factor Y)